MDHEGNRIGSATYTGPACRTNRISEMDQAQLRYDDAGNLIEKRTPYDLQSFEYDGLQRLSSVTRQRPGYPTTKTYYVYDALSRRIAKQVFPERCPSQLTRYGWDGDQLVHEDTGEQRTTVFYEPGTFVPLFRVDELGVNALEAQGITLEQLIQENIDTSRYSAFITDHLGTPTKLIDEDGHLLWSAEPDDWAAIKDERTVPNLQQPIRFQGQWQDEETGLYYNRYRYYDPKQGRYITQDPIGLAGGLNSYAYVSNPTGWVDPLGLFELSGYDFSNLNSIQANYPTGSSKTLRCARELGSPDSPPMKPSGNPFRHDFLVVDGDIFSFQAGGGPFGMVWSQGYLDKTNESPNALCTTISDDPKYADAVRQAAEEVGKPKYNVGAYLGTWPHLLGARNCQTWADDVLKNADRSTSKSPAWMFWR